MFTVPFREWSHIPPHNGSLDPVPIVEVKSGWVPLFDIHFCIISCLLYRQSLGSTKKLDYCTSKNPNGGAFRVIVMTYKVDPCNQWFFVEAHKLHLFRGENNPNYPFLTPFMGGVITLFITINRSSGKPCHMFISATYGVSNFSPCISQTNIWQTKNPRFLRRKYILNWAICHVSLL